MKFLIRYKNPETEEIVEKVEEFEDTETVTAAEWAEDYAYGRADKGWHEVVRLKDIAFHPDAQGDAK